MTEADARLAVLAACLLPGGAAAMLARLGQGGPAAVAHASGLRAAPRRERLAAFAAAVSIDPAGTRARAEALAARERPRVASLLRLLGSGTRAGAGISPALVRICRERIEG